VEMGDMSALVVAEGGGSNFLVPNGTFFVELAIFLIVLGVIGTFVVPPISRVLKERENMVTKTAADNKKSAEQFAAAQEDYEKALSAARVTASAGRGRGRGGGGTGGGAKAGRVSVAAGRGAVSRKPRGGGGPVGAGPRRRGETLSPPTLGSRILGVEIS